MLNGNGSYSMDLTVAGTGLPNLSRLKSTDAVAFCLCTSANVTHSHAYHCYSDHLNGA